MPVPAARARAGGAIVSRPTAATYGTGCASSEFGERSPTAAKPPHGGGTRWSPYDAGEPAPGRHTATVRAVAEEWQRLAGKGVIRARSREQYKGAAIRAYERHLRLRVLPGHADVPLADLTRHDWQALVDELLANGAAPSTVNGAVAAVSALYEHEIGRGRLADNPTRRVKMPRTERSSPPHRFPGGGNTPPRSGSGQRPGDMGHGDVRRPAPRGTTGAPPA